MNEPNLEEMLRQVGFIDADFEFTRDVIRLSHILNSVTLRHDDGSILHYMVYFKSPPKRRDVLKALNLIKLGAPNCIINDEKGVFTFLFGEDNRYSISFRQLNTQY